MSRIVPIVLALAALSPSAAWAANYGTNGVSCTHATLANAIAAAGAGGTVFVKSGTRNPVWQTITSNLTIRGADANCANTGSATMDVGGAQRHFTITNGATLTLEDLTLTNGSATNGGSIEINNGSLVLQDTVIQSSSATQDGGCIWGFNASVDMLGSSRVEFCDAGSDGGAVYVDYSDVFVGSTSYVQASIAQADGGGIYATDSEVEVGGHVQSSSAARGGGLFVNFELNGWDHLDITGTGVVTGNTADDGAGVYAQGAGMFVSLYDGAAIELNDTLGVGDGGGVYLTGGANLHMEDDGRIVDNAAVNGGGVYQSGSATDMVGNSRITGNDADLDGGGAYVGGPGAFFDMSDDAYVRYNTAGDDGGGLYVYDGDVDLNDTIEIGSNTSADDGGGLWLGGGASLTFTGNNTGARVKILDNSADSATVVSRLGGGVYLQDEGTSVTGTLGRLEGNGAGGSGGGVYLGSGTTWDTDNTRLIGNAADSAGGNVYVYDAAFTLDVDDTTCTPSGLLFEHYCSEITSGSAVGGGGGIFASTDAVVRVNHTMINENRSGFDGDAVYLSAATADVRLRNDLVIDDGTATNAAVSAPSGTFTSASSTYSGLDVPVSYGAGATGSFNGNIVWGNASDMVPGAATGNCNITQTLAGAPSGTGNLQSDPLFTTSAHTDYWLGAASPAIDTCLTGFTEDILFTARPVDFTAGTPNNYDMGAFERN